MADSKAITNEFAPTAFVRQIVAAVLPLIHEDTLREDKSWADVFKALRPIIGHYTISDAFLVWQLLRSAQNASFYSEDAESGALYQATWLLETFVARGWPSSADCVSARAAALEPYDDGESTMGDYNDSAARSGLSFDVSQIRSGRYFGERLGAPAHTASGLPLWLSRAMEDKASG